MPIYEYECKLCGHHLEAFQNMSDKVLKTCPSCHKPGLQKLVSAAGFQLKGTGWYATDFKNKKKPEVDKTETKETKGKDDKSSSSSTTGSST